MNGTEPVQVQNGIQEDLQQVEALNGQVHAQAVQPNKTESTAVDVDQNSPVSERERNLRQSQDVQSSEPPLSDRPEDIEVDISNRRADPSDQERLKSPLLKPSVDSLPSSEAAQPSAVPPPAAVSQSEDLHQESALQVQAPGQGALQESHNVATPPPIEQKTSYNAMQPEPTQHRHHRNHDHPASYKPIAPVEFLQLRALALQLPSSQTHASSQHNDPPTLILEGRTNVSTARRSFYPRVTRTLPELQLWILALTLSYPTSIFSPFSYPPSSLVAGNMHDATIRSYLTLITNQFVRILNKQYVLHHPATVALVESDFSYHASMPHVGPGSSPSSLKKMEEATATTRMGFNPLTRRAKGANGTNATSTWDVDGVAAALGLPALHTNNAHETYGAPVHTNKNPLSLFSRNTSSPQRITPQPPVPIPPGEEDEDEEDLTAARNEITRLELQFEQASKAAAILVERKGAMTATLHQLNQALKDLANLDAGRSVARRTKEEQATSIMSKGLESWAASLVAESSTMMSTLEPSLGYQSSNARSAIDALLRRATVATHRYSSLVVLVQKRREAERLKRARGAINQDEVDLILAELREAQQTTHALTQHLTSFTSTLKQELKEHSRNTHNDLQNALLQHARSSVKANKFALDNLVKARDDLVALREGRSIEHSVGTLQSQRSPERHSQGISGGDVSHTRHTQEAAHDSLLQQTANTGGQSKSAAPIVTEPLVKKTDGVSPVKAPELLASTSTTSLDSRHKDLPEAPTEDPIDVMTSNAHRASVADAGVPEVSVADTGVSDTSALDAESVLSSAKQSAQQAPQLATTDSVITQSTTDYTKPPTGIHAPAPLSQSAFLPSPSSTDSHPPTSDLSQSAWISGRNMGKYANPFARMDSQSPSAPPSRATHPREQEPREQEQNPHVQSVQKPNDVWADRAQKPNDVWANRSRISASEAARSLAGRF